MAILCARRNCSKSRGPKRLECGESSSDAHFASFEAKVTLRRPIQTSPIGWPDPISPHRIGTETPAESSFT